MADHKVKADTEGEDTVLEIECLNGGEIDMYLVNNGISLQSAELPQVRFSSLLKSSLRMECSEHGFFAVHVHPITSGFTEPNRNPLATPFLVLEPIQNVERVRIEGIMAGSVIPDVL